MQISACAKWFPRLLLGALLWSFLGAATCDGLVEVFRSTSSNKGECALFYDQDHPPGIQFGDILQLADSSNVNDFIQCKVVEIHATVPPVVVFVSPQDAEGHSFVGVYPDLVRYGFMYNLSR